MYYSICVGKRSTTNTGHEQAQIMDSPRNRQHNEIQKHTSILFTVRVWPHMGDEGPMSWRGQVRCVTSGDTSYFREWPVLVDLMKKILAEIE